MPVSIQGVQLVRLPPCSYTTAAFPSNEAVGLLREPIRTWPPSPGQQAETKLANHLPGAGTHRHVVKHHDKLPRSDELGEHVTPAIGDQGTCYHNHRVVANEAGWQQPRTLRDNNIVGTPDRNILGCHHLRNRIRIARV